MPHSFVSTYLLSGTTRHCRLTFTFPASVQSALIPRSPGSFPEEWYLEIKIWVLGVFITIEVPLLVCPPRTELGDINMYGDPCIHIALCLFLYLCSYENEHTDVSTLIHTIGLVLAFPFSLFLTLLSDGEEAGYLYLFSIHLFVQPQHPYKALTCACE